MQDGCDANSFVYMTMTNVTRQIRAKITITKFANTLVPRFIARKEIKILLPPGGIIRFQKISFFFPLLLLDQFSDKALK